MSKPKFDLSNVGGQPKGWMQKEHEKEVASSGSDFWVSPALIGLPLLIVGCAILFLYAVFQ